MKKLMISAVALMIAASAYGQGKFIFNTHDTVGGNVLTFTDAAGKKIAGPDYFVQVLAGADANSLTPVTGDNVLVINRVASGAPTGFTNPFSSTYTVPGITGGKTAVVGYRAYQGTSWDTATVKSTMALATAPVTLVEDPTPANQVALGVQTVTLVPEPATWALGLLGLGTLLAIRRRK
jgi:MYXO-CTERM domain-containing protein